MSRFGRFKPDYKVILRRAANGYRDEDISNDLTMITTTKHYGNGAGGFSLTTTYKASIEGKRYDQVVKSDDIVSIWLDKGDGSGLKSVMIGLVDRAGRVRGYDSEGRPQFKCRINGMDFGKILLKHDLIVDLTPLRDTETGDVRGGDIDPHIVRIAKGVAFTGTPEEMIEGIYGPLIDQQLTLPPLHMGLWFPDQTPDDWQIHNKTFPESTGSLWNALKSVANEPFNVLTTETYDDKLYVILERFPFDAKTGRLTLKKNRTAPLSRSTSETSRGVLHVLKDYLITNEDLGESDNERTNYVYLKAPSFALADSVAGMPIQYQQGIFNGPQDDIKTHGFRPWQVQTNFQPATIEPTAGEMKQAAFGAIQARAELLWNRVRRNHEYESGNITIHGMPELKAGDGIISEDGYMEYFCEQVGHSVVIGDKNVHYTTQAGLTRGQKHGQ